MQEAVPVGVGAMAAMLGLDCRSRWSALCDEAAQGEVVRPANYNGPEQIVIAGHGAAVDRAATERPARRAPSAWCRFAVSAPFHCAADATRRRAPRAGAVRAGVVRSSLPVYTNVDAAPVTTAAAPARRWRAR